MNINKKLIKLNKTFNNNNLNMNVIKKNKKWRPKIRKHYTNN